MNAPRTLLTKSLKLITTGIISSLLFTGCGGDPSFSLTKVSEKLDQDTLNTQLNKIDVLWVIDNSISMYRAQTNLTNNFKSFIDNFSDKDLDFQLAVAASDSYRSNKLYSEEFKPTNSWFRDGARTSGAEQSGVYVINPNTTNLNKTFVTNASLGTAGFGDERVFSSIEAALDDPFNKKFLRADSFLAIIIVSDEDDASYPGKNKWDNIKGQKPELYPVSKFTDYLDQKTGLGDGKRRYNVSSIHIKSDDFKCLNSLKTGDQKFGERYEILADKTGGSVISLCSDFSKSLDELSEDIIEASLSDSFKISRRPIPSTIKVKVNGKKAEKAVDGLEGWYYSNPEDGVYLIQFTEDAIPPSGARVDITFDPYEFK